MGASPASSLLVLLTSYCRCAGALSATATQHAGSNCHQRITRPRGWTPCPSRGGRTARGSRWCVLASGARGRRRRTAGVVSARGRLDGGRWLAARRRPRDGITCGCACRAGGWPSHPATDRSQARSSRGATALFDGPRANRGSLCSLGQWRTSPQLLRCCFNGTTGGGVATALSATPTQHTGSNRHQRITRPPVEHGARGVPGGRECIGYQGGRPRSGAARVRPRPGDRRGCTGPNGGAAGCSLSVSGPAGA